MDSKAIVGPLGLLLAIAKELLAAPLLAQPPRPQAIASRTVAIAARGAALQTRNKTAETPLIVPRAISLKSINV